jgi:hypothetical protein
MAEGPHTLEAIEFDTADPDYQKPVWRYFMERRSR